MSPPSRTEIEKTVKRILTADLGVDPALVAGSRAGTPLVGDGITLDSVETVGLALGLEREFGIEIPDGDLTVEMFESLGALVDYVLAKIGEQPATRAASDDGGHH